MVTPAVATEDAPQYNALAQLRDQQQLTLQHQLSMSTQRQRLLEQLILANRDGFEPNKVLQLAVEEMAQILQADQGMFLRLNPATPQLNQSHKPLKEALRVQVLVESEWFNEAQAENGPQIGSYLNHTFWVSECFLCQHALIRSPIPLAIDSLSQLVTEQINSGLQPIPDIAPVFNPQVLPALLIAPVESQGTVLGFLVVQQGHSRHWQPVEAEFLELIAAQISTTLAQTPILRQTQALLEEQTFQLQKSLDVQAKLHKATQRQGNQLQRLNQVKDEFLSTVSHELLTPLTSMTLAIRLLRQSNLPFEQHLKYLDILEAQCSQETRLINDLLKLQQLELQQVSIQPQTIDLRALIQRLAQEFGQQWIAKGLVLAIDLSQAPLWLQSDLNSLNRILIELLTNAGKYSAPNTTIRLQVSHQVHQATNEVILSLSNTGSGISTTDLPYIFNKFRRGQGVTQQATQGTGLGLALVKQLVELINGKITVSSYPLETTQTHEICFTLALPQLHSSSRETMAHTYQNA